MFIIHHSFYMHKVSGTGPQKMQLKVGTIHTLAGDLNKKITNDYKRNNITEFFQEAAYSQ